MTIPFLRLFQRKSRSQATPEEAPASSPHIGAVEKRSNESLRKTVMPNAIRVVGQSSAFSSGPKTPASLIRAMGLPPSVALALEPAVERTISLELGDVWDRIPKDYLKEDEKPDLGRRVLFKASAVEKGMANGKPSTTLAVLYEQFPEIFAKEIAASDSAEIALPFEKVLEQFNTVRVREDQERDRGVPQIETPILQITLEDTERFGTKMEHTEVGEMPPIKVQPATAKSISDAEPESVVRETAPTPRPSRSTIPLTQAIPSASAPKPPAPPISKTANPARIPFNLPPNGTGAPASERVPASSGPPVPTPPPVPPSPSVSAPTPSPTPSSSPAGKTSSPRLALKVAPPSDDLKPKLTLVPGVERREDSASAPAAPSSAVADMQESAVPTKKMPEPSVAIPLRLTLQNVPPFQLEGNVAIIPEDARIELPLSLIQPQLAGGRVAIAPKIFREAMPEDYRKVFVIDEAETSVLLPLQEVLKSLPDGALKMRADQEQTAIAETIETAFSIKAKEDAERFGKETAAASPKVKEPKKKADVKPTTPAVESKAPPKVDAKEVVTRAATLPGVAGCAVTFTDGLIVAQNFPANVALEGLCAAAPALRQRIEQHTSQSTLGELKSITLLGEKSAITFFMQGNICLTALHGASDLASESRTKLAQMAGQLTETYAQPEKSNVHH